MNIKVSLQDLKWDARMHICLRPLRPASVPLLALTVALERLEVGASRCGGSWEMLIITYTASLLHWDKVT